MTTSDAPARNRLSAWMAPATALAAVLSWNAAAWAVDLSPLEQEVDSWGFAFATTIYTALYGIPLLLVTALGAGIAHFSRAGARWGLALGAVACAVAALGLFALMVLVIMTEGPHLTSDVVFLVATALVAGGLTVPFARLRRSVAAFPVH